MKTLLICSALALIPSVALANPKLDTRMVATDAKLTTDQCVAKAKTALGDLLKGSKGLEVKADASSARATTAEIVVQVECLQGQKINAAYIVASGTVDGPMLQKATEQLAKAFK